MTEGLFSFFARLVKLSSKSIYNYIRVAWNLTAWSKLYMAVFIIAPPFMRRVAASGTLNTLIPFLVSTCCKCVKAVVFPAHGPPVRHILWICWFSFPCPIYELFDEKKKFDIFLALVCTKRPPLTKLCWWAVFETDFLQWFRSYFISIFIYYLFLILITTNIH